MFLETLLREKYEGRTLSGSQVIHDLHYEMIYCGGKVTLQVRTSKGGSKEYTQDSMYRSPSTSDVNYINPTSLFECKVHPLSNSGNIIIELNEG